MREFRLRSNAKSCFVTAGLMLMQVTPAAYMPRVRPHLQMRCPGGIPCAAAGLMLAMLLVPIVAADVTPQVASCDPSSCRILRFVVELFAPHPCKIARSFMSSDEHA